MNEAIWREQLKTLARGSDWFMAGLHAAQSLDLPPWCIGAGAVRNLVWDALHGHARPSALADVDLAYFDASDVSAERDAARWPQVSIIVSD
jgi:uncharacterized protein